VAEHRAELIFWGVRGGIPTPGADTTVFGGNSPCVEVDCGDRIIVFDAGTGLRILGQSLMPRSPVRGDLLFGHTNFNRICGLPFFAAALHPKNSFAFWCGHEPEEGNIHAVLTRLMTDPVFPVPLDIFNAELTFNDFKAGNPLDLDDKTDVTTLPVTCGLPGTAYRVTSCGVSLGYACAIRPPEDLTGLIDFVRGCDFLILSFVGEDVAACDRIALDVAQRGEVGQVFLTDHAPDASDGYLLRREEMLIKQRSSVRLAREGDRIALV
jgi:phosphoribosyl 1,2-cyclic phosphodiesterase